MSKITFRADDDLVEAVEELDASKSEVMREALREFLGMGPAVGTEVIGTQSIDESLDELIARKVDAALDQRMGGRDDADQHLNVNIQLDGVNADATTASSANSTGRRSSHHEGVRPSDGTSPTRNTSNTGHSSCAQCGSGLDPDHVYCPNCGEHSPQGFYCECGETLEADWSFCPGCGRQLARLDYLEP